MEPQGQSTDLVQLNTIRVETVISRHPIHCLAKNKNGEVRIDISEQDDDGEIALKWRVSPSSDYGQPGPLAYKIDTLVINRRIEEARPRVPRLIKLGSLSDLCKELGLVDSGKNRADIKKALFQNAFAGIVPYLRYKHLDGSEDTLETAFNRYAVILTGKKLPDGRKADGVYISLSDVYMHVLNGAMTRPLDYDYLRSLPPAPQRFYELLSYQMYATLKHDRPRAKLTYSAFCAHAPQKRYTLWKRVRSQMTSIHRKHLESGYIAEVDYQETTDKNGHPDWIMFYKPGPRARAEFRAATKRGGPTMLEIEPLEPDATAGLVEPLLLDHHADAGPLAMALISRGVTPKTAADLVDNHPSELIEQQIDVVDWLASRQDKRLEKSPAGYLVKSIVDGYAVPKGYVSREERLRQEEAKRASEQKAAEERRRKQADDARERAELNAADAYIKRLSPERRPELEAAALAAAGEQARQSYENPALARFRETFMLGMLRDHVRELLKTKETPLS